MITASNDSPTQDESPAPNKDEEVIKLREEVSRLQLTAKVLREDQQYSNDWVDALRYEMRNLTADNLQMQAMLKRLSEAGVSIASPAYWSAIKDVQNVLGLKGPAPEAVKS